ncbi:MAG TPA: glycosyltransferase 87 family protein, partial [Candidatus Tectomicrobia bacterium]|nr:glycosyltransferase 87 family protein [Candidatus Tectomicrobia bacterium]
MTMPLTIGQHALRIDAQGIAARLAPLLLAAVIGAELLVLATWGPDTFAVWRDPATHGDGDFGVFYENARTFSFNALYSPGLTVLMHPLTYLDVETAFRVYFAVNVAALLGVAWIAQAGVRSPLAKAAVALGVLALPQTHWALRVGHFTEVLALAAL